MKLYLPFALLPLCHSAAVARENFDPLNSAASVPAQPSLGSNSLSSDLCGSNALDGVLTLPDVVNTALCNNPQTRLAWLNSRAAAEQIAISQSAYLPGVDINASASHSASGNAVDQRSVVATVSYLIYDFGSRSANLEISRQLLAAASASQDSTVQAVFLESVRTYYQQQATLAALNAAKESERAAHESFLAADARYRAGSATPADKLQAQTAYAQATLNHITAEGNFKNAQGALANTLGLDANKNVTLEAANTSVVTSEFEGDINALIELAKTIRPDLQAAAAQVKAAQSRVEGARTAGRPSISASASTSRNYSSGFNTNTSLVGINLSVPIFSGFSTTYKVRVAEVQLDSSTTQLEQLKSKVALDVWTAVQNLTTATQAMRSSDVLLSSAEQSERVALGRYKSGVGSMLDVLNAQSALASARQQRVQSTFDWNISRATLAQAVGNLDGRLLQTLMDSVNPAAGIN
ncbi:MAG: TolC family protein [Gallionella sp.]